MQALEREKTESVVKKQELEEEKEELKNWIGSMHQNFQFLKGSQ